MGNFRKLRVWETALQIAIDSARVAARMRGARNAVLRDQLIRAAMSVPTNIVEGCSHASPREFARYLSYSLASANELEGHLQLAHDLNLMTERDFKTILALIVDARMMLHGLLRKLRGSSQKVTEGEKPEADNGSRWRITGNR